MRLKESVIRVVDFETTGLDEKESAPCEVGWVDLKYEDEWKFGEPKSLLMNPGHPIPSVAKAVHHITDDEVKDAPPPEEVLPLIFADSSVTLFAAHNAEFDKKFAPPGDATWLCTMRLAKHLIPSSPSYSNQVLRYELGFDKVPGDAHRASHDVAVTAMILCHMLAMGKKEDPTVEDLVEYAASPVYLTGKIGFGKHFDKTWQQAPSDYLQWMQRQGSDSWDIDQWFTINRILNPA